MKKRSKYYQGKFNPRNPVKYKGKSPIFFRSSWESKFMVYMDSSPSVIEWGSESAVIDYFDQLTKTKRRYYIDFSATIKDKNGAIRRLYIEVKPYCQTLKPVRGKKREKTFLCETATYIKNACKWEAAAKWAKSRGAEFRVLTENDFMF